MKRTNMRKAISTEQQSFQKEVINLITISHMVNIKPVQCKHHQHVLNMFRVSRLQVPTLKPGSVTRKIVAILQQQFFYQLSAKFSFVVKPFEIFPELGQKIIIKVPWISESSTVKSFCEAQRLQSFKHLESSSVLLGFTANLISTSYPWLARNFFTPEIQIRYIKSK